MPFSLAMPEQPRSLPLADPGPAPARFVDKYRPRTLAEVVGQGYAVSVLSEFAAAPFPSAFLFSGPTGVGKTTLAQCLANAIGAVEFGGLYTINSGTQDADAVESTLKACYSTPMPVAGASGWRLVIVDECDHCSAKARQVWLSALDDLPPRTVIVFTTNHPAKLEQRFIDRTTHLEFQSSADVLMQDVQILVDHICAREGIASVDARTIPGLADTSGAISFRRVADRMQGIVLAKRAASRAASVVNPPPVRPEPVADPIPQSDQADVVVDVQPAPAVATSPEPTPTVESAPKRTRKPRAKNGLERAEESIRRDDGPTGPIQAIEQIDDQSRVWIRSADRQSWRLHVRDAQGFCICGNVMESSAAIRLVLVDRTHRPIPIPAGIESSPPASGFSDPAPKVKGSHSSRIIKITNTLRERCDKLAEGIASVNALVTGDVNKYRRILDLDPSSETVGEINRIRTRLDGMRQLRGGLLRQLGLFSNRLVKLGFAAYINPHRIVHIPTIPEPRIAFPEPAVEPAVEPSPEPAPAPEVATLSSTDDVRGLPNPHVAIVSVVARAETYGRYRCEGSIWERIPETSADSPVRIPHDLMGYYLRRGDAIPVASWRIGAFPTSAESRDWTPPVPPAEVSESPRPIVDYGIKAVSVGPDRIRIRFNGRWILHTLGADDVHVRDNDDWIGSADVARGLTIGEFAPIAIPDRIGFRHAAPIRPEPADVDTSTMIVTAWSIGCPIVQHATDEFRDGIPCNLMRSAGRMSDADRAEYRARNAAWRRALSPLANRIRKPRPVPPPPPDPVPPPPPRDFSGLYVGIRGALYQATIIANVIRLESPKGKVYDVLPCLNPENANHGYSCGCPDHETRHRGLPTKGCKHLRALRDCGMIPPIPAPQAPTDPPAGPDPEPSPSPRSGFSGSVHQGLSGDTLIIESLDMSGNVTLSAWLPFREGSKRYASIHTDESGRRWGAMNSQLMPSDDVARIESFPELRQIEIAKEWRKTIEEACYATIERCRPDAIGGRRDWGTILLPAPERTRPLPSEVNESWRQPADDDAPTRADRVTLDRDSATVRIYFPTRPSNAQRTDLRNDGWRWNAEGRFWAKGYSQSAEDFAARYL